MVLLMFHVVFRDPLIVLLYVVLTPNSVNQICPIELVCEQAALCISLKVNFIDILQDNFLQLTLPVKFVG